MRTESDKYTIEHGRGRSGTRVAEVNQVYLTESEDVEAFLTAFERAVEAHGVEKAKWAVLLAPQLTGKALQAYAAMGNTDAKEYEKVKEAIFSRYDINEETYRRRFRTATWMTNETPVEMLTRPDHRPSGKMAQAK